MSQTVYLRRAAAEYLRKNRGIPCSAKTLAKLAEAKISKPVQSTSEYEDRQSGSTGPVLCPSNSKRQ